MPDRKARIFISHSAKETCAQEIQAALYTALENSAALVPLMDRRDLKPGDLWRARIDLWVGGCDAAVVLLSPKALDSPWVAYEATLLMDRKKRDSDFLVLPVYIDVTPKEVEASPLQPTAITSIQNVPELGRTVEEIVADVVKKLEKEVRSRRWRVRRRHVATILALVALTAWGGWLAYSRSDAYLIRSILRENTDPIELANSPNARQYLAALTILKHDEDALSLAVQAPEPENQVESLAVVAAVLANLQKEEQARKVVQQAEGVIASVGEPGSASHLMARLITVVIGNNPTRPMPAYLRESLLKVHPAERFGMLADLVGYASEGGNVALERDLLATAEKSAANLAPQDCGPLLSGALQLARSGKAGQGWTLVQKSGCEKDKYFDPKVEHYEDQYGGMRAESLALLGQREKALALLATAEKESWEGTDKIPALQALGRAYLALHDYGRAEDLGKKFDKGLLTEVFVAQGKIKEALAVGEVWSGRTARVIVQALLRTYPRSEVERLVQGQPYYNIEHLWVELVIRGDLAEAEKVARKELDLGLEDRLANLAEHYVYRGDLKDAERILSDLRQQAAQSRDDTDRESVNLAICRTLAALGRYQEARLLAEKIPDRLKAQAWILAAYAREKNPQAAELVGF